MKIYTFKNLSFAKNIIHGVSTKCYGTIKDEDGSINKENLGKFINDLDLPVENVVKMNQIHSGEVRIVETRDEEFENGIDGMITNKKNIPLYVLTADCLPILFYDPKKQAIGVAHGGRKGLKKKIVENMVNKFRSEFDSNPSDLIVGIGPGIEKKCYEVDSELVDIRDMAKIALIKKGIKEENIEISDICTKCSSDLFYSYRRGDTHDRFASVITLI